MATFLSPAVFVNEIDLSALPNNASGISPAIIGTAKKGPVNTPTLVTNAQNFVDIFGEPFPESFLGYAVLAYLEEGNLCWVLRVGVEAEEGQVDELASIAIDTTGARESGWGRIPLFKGIDFGKLTTRTENDGFVFHDDSVTFDEFNDNDDSTTFGPTDATMDFTGSAYTAPIDDSYILLLTGAPSETSGSNLDGATYVVIRSSDGAEILSGALVESATPDVSESINIGDGITFIITVISGKLDVNDSFRFTAVPDNREFQFVWDWDTASSNTFLMPAGSYTAATFADAVNTLVSSTEDYIAIDNDDQTVTFRTETAGQALQVIGSEAFSLEVGMSLYQYDAPRSFIEGTENQPFLINSKNNSITIQVVSSDSTIQFTAPIPVGSNQSAATIANSINASATVNGDKLLTARALTVPGGEVVVSLETTVGHQFNQIRILANSSHPNTLRFAEEMGFRFPYSNSFRGFTDLRVVLPAGGTITEASPLSCELNPSSADCAIDSTYFENIVGWLVATSPGTWVNDYRIDIELFNGSITQTGSATSGTLYTLKIEDRRNGLLVDRIDEVSFDPRAARYIGNIVNTNTVIGGVSGNQYINWIERPSFLNNDVNDVSTFEVREPASFFNREFTGGANGIPADPIYSSELDRAVIGNPANETGIYKFANPEVIDISLLLTPGFSSGAVITTAIAVCSTRGDTLYITDPPFGLTAQQVVDWHNGLLFTDLQVALDTSYGALYHPWVKVFDQFNGGTLFIPPSGHVAAVFARTDRVAEIWFAPAGLNRGKLITALDVEVEHTRGQRDLMYGFNNAVNPIMKFPQRGIHIFGQRTLQRKDSALDRVNVRMLLIAIKKALAGPRDGVLYNFLFEPNDAITRRQVVSIIDNFMSDVAARRGVTAWKTICDDTNNTPIRIDRNELWISLLVKPTRAIEFIVLNIGILRTDQSFTSSEVLAAVGVNVAVQ